MLADKKDVILTFNFTPFRFLQNVAFTKFPQSLSANLDE